MAKKKNLHPKPITGFEKDHFINDRYSLPGLLIQQADEDAQKKFSDYNLDREKEIFELLNGTKLSLWHLNEANKQLRKFIAQKKREYAKTFPDELYAEWRRLRGWDSGDYQKHHKPWIFARYTIKFLYGRFPKEVLPALEELNEFITHLGKRLTMHFEWLSDESYGQLKSFIRDVINVSKTCSNFYEFNLKYAAKYGPPFQQSLFEDNDGILGLSKK